MLFGMLSLCCLVWSVVDHMLLISGGFFMIVHMLFWGYPLVILSWEELPLVYVVLFISSFLVILSFPCLFFILM